MSSRMGRGGNGQRGQWAEGWEEVIGLSRGGVMERGADGRSVNTVG